MWHTSLRSVHHTHGSPPPSLRPPLHSPRPPPYSFATLSRPWRTKALRKPPAYVLKWLQDVPKCGTTPQFDPSGGASPPCPLRSARGQRLRAALGRAVVATLPFVCALRLALSRSVASAANLAAPLLSFRLVASLSRLHSFAPPTAEVCFDWGCKYVLHPRTSTAPLTRFVGGPRPLRCALGAPISPGLPPHARFSRSRYARGERSVATLRFFFCWALVGAAAMASGSAAAVAYASPFGLGAACPRFPPFLSGKTGAASSCPGGWRFSVGRRA